MATNFSPDLPELRLLAQVAGVAPSRMAAAFSDPEHFTNHMTVEEINRFKEGCDRLFAVQADMTAALNVYLQSRPRLGVN